MYGTHLLRLDEKGRMILPARVRSELSEDLYLTRGQDHCIYLFSSPQFEEFKRVTRENVPEGIDPRAFDRLLFSSVTCQEPDKQGRLTIPGPLRAYAGLDRDLAVIGLETRMEIWDVVAWDAYVARYEAAFAALPGGVR